jgi:hypothetical protein
MGREYLRKILGPKRQKAKGLCRGLHNEELQTLYSLQISYYEADKIEDGEMVWTCSTHRGDEKCIGL